MKMSRTVAYAVQAALQLAQSSGREPIPCSRLAAEGHMPERFLLQILRSMVTHGILHSTRGVEGGYTLERPSSDISLLDIVEAVEGPVTSAYIEGLSAPVQSRLNKAMDDINDCLVRELSSIKLSHLIPPQNSEYGPHRYLQN